MQIDVRKEACVVKNKATANSGGALWQEQIDLHDPIILSRIDAPDNFNTLNVMSKTNQIRASQLIEQRLEYMLLFISHSQFLSICTYT